MVEKKLERLQNKKKTKKMEVDVFELLKAYGKKKEEIEQITSVYHVLKEFSEL